MSKITYVIATLALVGVLAFVGTYSSTSRNLAATSDSSVEDLWAHWKQQYGKMYATAEEEQHKFVSFKANFEFVQKWTADPTQTSSVGLNEYADLNTEEFGALKGCLMAQPSLDETVADETEVVEETGAAPPASWDWRAQGAVTPIKNQGQCGSCWSFSTTGTLEGLNFLTNKNLLSFSEQQLVDCSGSYGNQGCDGGWPFWALEYTAAKGIELEATYPYTAADGTCKYQQSQVKFTNKGYGNVTSKNEVSLLTSVYAQPTSVCVEADQNVFQLYTGGVITSASCGTQLDHAILAVGWSTSGSTPYWIVKNSWGTSWGLQGYVYIGKSSSTNTPGICGIALNAAFGTM